MFSNLIQKIPRIKLNHRIHKGDNPLFRRLRTRITLLAVILLIILYGISSFAVFAIVQGWIYRVINHNLLLGLHHVMVDPRHGPGFGVTAMIQASPTETDFIGPVSHNQSGSLATILTRTVAHMRNPGQMVPFSFSGESYLARYQNIGTPVTDSSGHSFQPFLATFMDVTPYFHVLKQLKHVIFLVGIFGLTAAGMVGFFLAERMLRPIRSAWQRQLEFVADASHELRTPLSVIQSNLGIVMEHTNESVTENLEWLNNAHGESRRLSKLVRDLLTLARSDSERMPIEREEVDLQDLILHIHELYETVADMRGILLRVDAPSSHTILGDRDRLHQLLVILLDNAVKFTEPGGSIEISLKAQKYLVVISVTDTGLGIERENLRRVFDRFFTVDPARSREQSSNGTGLGLAIARWIVDAHGGKISIDSEGIGLGTVVRIELPTGGRLQLPAAPFRRK